MVKVIIKITMVKFLPSHKDYYGEIFAFPLGGNTPTVFQIDGAKYVNWEKNDVTSGTQHGNLYYSMGNGLIDATSREGRSYFVFKWNSKNLNDGNSTFNDSSVDSMVDSINNFKNYSDEYWQNVTHLATKYSKPGNFSEFTGHYVTDADMNGDATPGMKHGNALNKFTGPAAQQGFNPEDSQRLILVAGVIPTQVDDTKQEVDHYAVHYVYDDTLEPGQVKLVQKGVDGLKRTTNTTYYNVDLSSGKQTLDTSKGTDGHSTETTILNQRTDEIIHIGKQKATINYLKQDGTKNPVPITDENGKAIVGTVTGNPITINNGELEFDADGKAIANTINYTNYSTDLANAEGHASDYKYNVDNDEWAQAVKNKTNKYDVSKLSKSDIQAAAEKAGLNTAVKVTDGPVFNVILKKAVKENASLKIVDDTDNGKALKTLNATGDENTAISFKNGATTVQDYLNKGYKFVSVVSDANGNTLSTTNYDAANFGNYDTDPNSDQSFTVHLVHGTKPVNPENPTDKYTKNDLQKTSTRTINYVDAQGNKLADSVTSTVVFSGSGYVDTVTGNLVNLNNDGSIKDQNGKLTWTYSVDGGKAQSGENYTFAETAAKPTIQRDGVNYRFNNVNPGNYNAGNGAVSSYQVDNSKDNNLNVNVVYNRDVQDQTVTVKYFDDTKETDLSSYDKSISAKPGEALNYSTQPSITELENKGYKLLSDNFNVTTMPEKGGNYEVHFVHNTTTITPDKPGKPGEPINPNDPNGPKWPEGTDAKNLTKQGTQTVHYVYADGTKAADDNVQNTTFAHTLVFDNVTGKQIEDKGWTPESHKFNDVTSPEIDGYHADKKTVNGATVTVDDPTSETIVVYAKNDTEIRNKQEVKASQVVKYQDEDGNELSPSKSQNFIFKYTGDTYDAETGKQIATGKWINVSYDFNSEDVPTVDGYVAVKGYTRDDNDKVVAGGFTTTYDATDAKRNRTFVVVYKKVGKIIPVDPSKNPIPDAPTPSYKNDPTDPTKVTPDEPTPNVPGYTPSQNTVTPPDPTKDTPVVYTKNVEQKAKVQYIDLDDNNKVMSESPVLTGQAGDKIDYSTTNEIANYEKQGYVLADDEFSNNPVFDNVEGNEQIFKVTFHHGQTPVNPDHPHDGVNPDQYSKDVKETVHYVGAGEKTPADNVQNSKWTRTLTVDTVTNKVIENGQYTTDWSIAKGQKTVYDQVNTPVLEGYYADQANVPATAVTQDNIEKTVTYKPLGHIIPVDPTTGNPIPNAPQPQFPNDPTDPTKGNPGEKPNIPGLHPESGQPGDPVNPVPGNPGEDVKVPYVPDVVAKDQAAVVNYVDSDENNKVITTSGNLTGKSGSAIDYSTAATIKQLEDQGYVLVTDGFPAGATYDNDDNTTQIYTVVLKHGQQPVNPSTPGEPINPKDPEGPKYPQGSDQVTKTVTRTVQYVDENGNKISDSVEQPVNFTAQGVLDKVTGQWTTPLTWSVDQTVSAVKSPVIAGYHLVNVDRDGEGNNVKAVTLTHENDSYTVTVKYAKNGKIIPVDPTGKPIPNVPTPQYPTDPTDPSKVTPNEPVPSIPGLTPEVPTVTPTDPGKNTPVKYSQTVNATVNYIDNVTGKTLKTDSLSGLEGVKSDYSTKSSIEGYEAQGYALLDDGFPKDGYTFEVGGEHTFNVYLTHTTSPVTPDHPGAGYSATDLKKIVTRTINYLDGQGNVVAQQVAQSFDFIANGTVDNVTHKLVTVVDGKITGAGELTWNAANHDFDAVESPAVKGMHVTNVTPADQRDGNNVAKITVNAQSGNIIVNVYYASNGTHQDGAKNLPSTQTVTFVDEAGNVLHVPSTLDFTFVRTPDVTDPEGNVTEGTWTTGTSHTYKTVDVPVIPGYVTDRTVAGGMTATIDNLDVADKVVYKKVGKIIPVDPTGKPIPGAPTPDYPNDPQNPTKVTPDEPVPSVPGYTPDVPTVTPGVPTVDTPVTYRQNVQATVTYIDDVTNTVLDSDSLSGLDGKKSDYSTAGKIANYESHGYALVSDDFPKDGYTFSVEGTHNFTVHLTHSTSPVNPDHPGAGYNKTDLQKDVTRTIYFVNTQDGKQVAEPVNQTVSFTANGTVDNVTGKLVTVTDGKITGPGELTWTSAQDVKGVQSPAVNRMHVTFVTRDADGTNVKGVSLTHDDSSYDVYVNYAPNGTTNEHGQNIPASQTIKFVDESGNTLRENNVQTSEFVRTPDVVDAFTGKTITEGSWKETSHKFGVIDVPVIEGYVATVKTAGGLTATTDNPNVVTEVVYKKVGKIIPVDPTGKPIPNVPTPEYPNDPTDPTKVTPNEPVPTIPGYTPEVPTVTPTDPGKDTPVKYTPVDNTQNAQVRYIDLTDNKELANSGNLSGQPGDKINYSTADTIKSLTDKGYVLVNDGFPADAAFDNDKGHDQVFTVTFRHGTQPVNPNEPGKPGQPINPNDPEGPKYPQGSDQVTKDVTRTVQYVDENGNKISDPVEQTVNFTAEGVLDKVTGQWVTPLTWSGSQSVAGVKTPVVEGYHVVNVDRDGDGVNVKGVTLTHENDNYTVTVQYAKNGKIVPVDPTGKPIPNVPTPQYPTDPTDPTKVTPNEPVPTIPNYTPEVPMVTPTDPGVDTPVKYTPNTVNPKPAVDQIAVVNYVDQDNNNAQIATSGNLTGKAGSVINYSTADEIKQLEAQGYVLVTDGFPADATFDDNADQNQVFTVVLKHGHAPVGPKNPEEPGTPVNPGYPEGPKWPAKDNYSKDYTSTVHFVDNNGNKMRADNVQTSTWTRTLIIDKVTGQILNPNENWTSDKASYSEVKVPVINGYVADKANVPAKEAVQQNIEDTVTYTKVGNIVPVDPSGNRIPNVPVVPYTNDPTDPTKVVPNEPVPSVPGMTPNVTTVTPDHPTVDTPVVYTTPTPVTPQTPVTPEPETPAEPARPAETPAQPAAPEAPAAPKAATPAKTTPAAKQEAKKLPQTGNENSSSAAALGLAALGLTGLLAAGKKRRKED